jgi:hypothetical protein
MRITWTAALAAGAIAAVGCDFTGLPEDRGALTKGPGAGGGADASVQDASTAGDAASGADATVSADAGPAADAGDACAPKSAGELAVERCGARVCGTIDVTDNCGASRSISCGTCANGAPCESGGTCGCASETQQQLVNLHCGVGSCGDKSVTDRCGAQRTISCGTSCAGQGETCGGGDPGTANVCGCTPETAAQFCARYGKNCSTFSGPDNCGVRRTNVACGSCTLPQTCGGAGNAGVCGCTPTTCAAQGKNCGSIPDECGGTLDCSSTCSGLGATCGGGNPGTANVCGCTPESDQALCTLEAANCGSITAADRCGATRTVASCGTCSGTGVTCGGGGTPKQCGCTPESNAAFCTRVGADCGSKSGTDNCGQARSVANCGTCANGAACEADNRCPWSGGPPAPTCSAGTLPGGGACQACDLNTCGEPTCDDGTTAAANLGAGAFECQYRSNASNWATAISYCAGLGSGWRLPTKGEALRIASSPNVCRTPLSAAWATWTRTCAGAGLAWSVNDFSFGYTYQFSVDDFNNALCVR